MYVYVCMDICVWGYESVPQLCIYVYMYVCMYIRVRYILDKAIPG